jgi:hypothetical protein
MSERYPGYDVEAKRDSPSWNAKTREVIDRRLAVRLLPRFFTTDEWRTLEALCDRIMPQPSERPKVPLAAYVDQKMADDRSDGFRYAELPHQVEAWRRGLKALDEAARDIFGAPFPDILPARQDDLLTRMQTGELTAHALGDMPAKSFFAHRVLPDITHAYYATPTAWNEIGFGGPASPRGYVRLKLGRRDPWEAVEAQPGKEAKARGENARAR